MKRLFVYIYVLSSMSSCLTTHTHQWDTQKKGEDGMSGHSYGNMLLFPKDIYKNIRENPTGKEVIPYLCFNRKELAILHLSWLKSPVVLYNQYKKVASHKPNRLQGYQYKLYSTNKMNRLDYDWECSSFNCDGVYAYKEYPKYQHRQQLLYTLYFLKYKGQIITYRDKDWRKLLHEYAKEISKEVSLEEKRVIGISCQEMQSIFEKGGVLNEYSDCFDGY